MTIQQLHNEASHEQALALSAWLSRRSQATGAHDAFVTEANGVRSWPAPAVEPLPRPAAPSGPSAPLPQANDVSPLRSPAGPCPRCEAVLAEAEREREELLAALREPYVHAATLLGKAAAEVQGRAAQDVLQLATLLAERVVHRAVELDVGAVLRSLERALKAAGPLEELTVVCHPDDAAIIEAAAGERIAEESGRVVRVDVRASHEVQRGGCIVRFAEGTVDARMETQLAELSEAVARAVMDPSHSNGARR